MTSDGLKTFFYFLGFSLKTPVTMSIKSWSSIWSHVSFIFLTITLLMTTFLQLNIKFEFSYNVLRMFTIWLTNFLTFVCLASIAMGRKKEALFWTSFEIFSKTNGIFVVLSKSLVFWSNVKLTIFIASMFFPTIKVAFMFLRKSEEKTLPFLALSLLHIVTIRAVTIKLIYFTGKLELCLDHLRSLLSYQIVPIGGVRSLKKSWKICWKMSKLIEDVVGLPTVLMSGLAIVGTILNTYTAVISFYNKKLEIGVIFSMIAVAIEICVTSKSCHNCFNCYRTIKGQLHRLHSGYKTESFALQLMHQKISFSPMQMFSIDHMFVVLVSL